ncbi:T9SS type A sorting domain-containing protein [Ulvibacter antarcticus]|uniref:Putative secreted protein (Por secretion system target) n=1 Tax=Ulvibacter antarcticus TaxID=442714 RepID=A0A3L9YE60_9FLAO|nr:T9SS type A sorting domain-containing protein [Ulvibacter antarcticus]RMA57737.1 putative secreted protein (Por secretion system target) [Ulvibacter antarcticus]
MTKKISLFLGVMLLSFGAIAQTIVSTSPENKKVILEEFTGIHCVFCPDGHAIAQAIKDANPDNAFLINIHVGSYANPNTGEPDFRTPYGTAIVGQTGLVGYPAATVNRLNFPGYEQGSSGSTAMSRNRWTAASNQTLAVGSYANVGVEASINVQTNMLTVHVEGYYTGSSPEATNLLNVALLQNNTLGPQTGGNSGNEYNHQHRLVEMITGQWGADINTTTTGTFVDETYTYPIPLDYNGVPVDLIDLEVVAFISETHQKVVSGSGTLPTFTGITIANDASLESIEDFDVDCFTMVEPVIEIKNLGNDPITNLDIEYSINGGTPAVYNWTGEILSYYTEEITLPGLTYTPEVSNILNVTIPNDDNNSNNSGDVTFRSASDTSGSITMVLNTDGAGADCTYTIQDPTGTVVSSGGPYDNNVTIERTYNFGLGCYYTFTLIDAAGNGGTTLTLTDETGNQFFETDGSFTNEAVSEFSSTGALGVDDNALQGVKIYPNPVTSVLNIQNAEKASIVVFNMLGQTLLSKSDISMNEQIEVSQFSAGTYFVKIIDGNAVKTAKFIVAE